MTKEGRRNKTALLSLLHPHLHRVRRHFAEVQLNAALVVRHLGLGIDVLNRGGLRGGGAWRFVAGMAVCCVNIRYDAGSVR